MKNDGKGKTSNFKENKEAEPKARKKSRFTIDVEKYDQRCDFIFNAWKWDSIIDRLARYLYALVVTGLVIAQIAFVYWLVFKRLNAPSELPATPVEFLGVVGAILAESFGAFYLVVKYFFGKRPEDLEKISSFFLYCHPSRHGSAYRDKWKNSDVGKKSKT